MNQEKKIQDHYNPRLEKFEETYKILDWESREAQMARFEILLENVDLRGLSLLDVGCGCGDLYGLLKERGIDIQYTGIDILPGMIERAKQIHSGGSFHCDDLFGGNSICSERYDVVFTSGIFNLNLGNNADFFESALPILNSHADKYLVLNLLDEKSPGRDENYFYFNPSKVVSRVESLGRKVRLVTDYLANDFTIIAS